MGRLFGTDGIRGEANLFPMDGMTAFTVGQALTRVLGKGNGKVRIIIGRDTRISGDMLECALAAGIASMGGEPCPVGVLPTPAIAFLTADLHMSAGIVISASHNPFKDNGIKIFSAHGFKLTDREEQAIEDLVLTGGLHQAAAPSQDMGRRASVDAPFDRYLSFLRKAFPPDLTMGEIRIVLDTANGAAHRTAPALFSSLGARITTIHNTPDGTNINHNCGSQFTRDLRERVRETRASLGLALDGDGDRLIAVDEEGREITGDQIMFICARALKEEGRLKNNLLVTSVMSNLGLSKACRREGIDRRESRVGDRYVLEEMRRLGAVMGGEESGHVIMLDHHTTSDGVITALRLIAAMIRERKPLSQLASLMDVYPQRLINVEVRDKPEISSVPGLVEAIGRVETLLGDQGRVLVRYSGTQNLCRVMVEGPTDRETEIYCVRLAREVERLIG
ncbi:MAG: phosphoglucosamine mutase [Deltaproteobacteria bacterium]|nr:phosphoglucosamine mutase [Deltaproteobacteria bacterium]